MYIWFLVNLNGFLPIPPHEFHVHFMIMQYLVRALRFQLLRPALFMRQGWYDWILCSRKCIEIVHYRLQKGGPFDQREGQSSIASRNAKHIHASPKSHPFSPKSHAQACSDSSTHGSRVGSQAQAAAQSMHPKQGETGIHDQSRISNSNIAKMN